MIDLSERPWQETAEKADSCIALGMTSIYLYNRGNDFPWHLASDCEEGGSHRLDIATSVRFKGKHESGLEFSWSFDIERDDANGSSEYRIDRDRVADVMSKLPTKTVKKFGLYLADCAAKIQKRGDEYQRSAERQFSDAHLLRVLAKCAG